MNSIKFTTRDEMPELFEQVRPEFKVAALCKCGWRAVARQEIDLQGTTDRHLYDLCTLYRKST